MLENENSNMVKTLTKKSFKRNKLRNSIALAAIILITLMFTSLFVLAESIMKNTEYTFIRQFGNSSHIEFQNITIQEADQIKNHEAIRDFGKSVVIGYVESEGLLRVPTEIRTGDENSARYHFSFPTTGRMPEEKDEIALDTSVLKALGVKAKVGEAVELQWSKTLSGDEYHVEVFRLVGFWEGDNYTSSNIAWTSDGFTDEVLGTVMLDVIVKDQNKLGDIAKRIASDLGNTNMQYNTNWVYEPIMLKYQLREIAPLAIIILLVFMSGCLIIYNVFQISVSTDLPFYGRLKTLGTSPKQIQRILYGQVNYLCLVGIPIGLVFGYIFGSYLIPLIILIDTGSIYVFASPFNFICSALLAYLTMIIACYKPAKSAGRIVPADAMKQINSLDHNHKTMGNNDKSIPVIFQMSLSNLGRNKGRTITTVCSLTLALVLLSSLDTINKSFDINKYMQAMTVSDFTISDSSIVNYNSEYNPKGTTITNELIKDIEGLEGFVDKGYLFSQETSIGLSDAAYNNITNYYESDKGEKLEYMSYDGNWTNGYYNMVENHSISSVIFGIDGLIVDILTKSDYILEGKFDQEKFNSGGYVIAQGYAGPTGQVLNQPTYDVGDTILIHQQEFEVMMIVDTIRPIIEGRGSIESSFSLTFFLPNSKFAEMYPDNTMRKLFFNVESKQISLVEELLQRYMDDDNLPVISRNTLVQAYKDQTRASTIMLTTISLIIGFIGILNFINSMITSIVTRQKELAMMQSIGMTKSQLRKMLVLEGLDYAIIILMTSYTLSLLSISFGIKTYLETQWTSTFQMSITSLLICTPILLGIAVLIPLLCYQFIIKHSIVERFRGKAS